MIYVTVCRVIIFFNLCTDGTSIRCNFSLRFFYFFLEMDLIGNFEGKKKQGLVLAFY